MSMPTVISYFDMAVFSVRHFLLFCKHFFNKSRADTNHFVTNQDPNGFRLLENHKISLKYPDFEDYEHFYQMRFTPEVVYWADDQPHQISLEEYALDRITAQESNEIIERIIMLDGEPIGTITARDYVARTCQCTLGIVRSVR